MASYHHGDLRRVLLDSTMELVRERGVDGFTLREVARRAGVSHNAPYHHFRDRSALIAAVVIQGFEELLAAMERAAARARGGPLATVRALGLAYVRFAREDPERFKLLWRPELREGTGDEVEEAGEASYRPLLLALERARQEGQVPTDHDVAEQALMAWSTVHGLAMLLVDGPMRDDVVGSREVDRLTNAVIDVMLSGLATR
jgi:AcrR family transcriptional regulator